MATSRESDRKLRYRISYVLPLQAGSKADGGHRLGVNGLAIDPRQSLLYSGGRDGVVCAWDTNLDLSSSAYPDDDITPNTGPTASPLTNDRSRRNDDTSFPTKLRRKVQAHMDWINDISLVNNDQSIVTASSDQSIKIWSPAGTEHVQTPHTLGKHTDYAKVLASSGQSSPWIASGGLDRKVFVWDLSGRGEVLNIDVGKEAQNQQKGSVYALTATGNTLASGSIDSIVRLWDVRSGKRITRFVGHTDIVRSILLAQDGRTVMTASSDSTVKIWSVATGRCEYTLTMHQSSVWALYSDHPELKVFWSSDISGLIAKTDARGKPEWDQGNCVAICQETNGVSNIKCAGGYIWAATKLSSINRWKDVATDGLDSLFPASASTTAVQRGSVATITKARGIAGSPLQHASSSESPRSTPAPPITSVTAAASTKNLLRLSAVAPFSWYRLRDVETQTLHSITSRRQTDLEDEQAGVCVRSSPDFTIEGEHGLIKHTILNNKRQVLTTDTAGEVTLWDLIKCKPIKSFGKRHLEDVANEINPTESVANWCLVDTRMGALTCVLEDNNCFEAEMYADEYEDGAGIEFKEDQRINLGKWILRYIFDEFLREEMKRDDYFRKTLYDAYYPMVPVQEKANKAPGTLQLPAPELTSWFDASSAPTSVGSASTAKGGGLRRTITTPGLAIGLATPAINAVSNSPNLNTLAPVHETGSASTSARTSTDEKASDYFTQPLSSSTKKGTATTPGANGQPALLTPGGTNLSVRPDSSSTSVATPTEDLGSPTSEKAGLFGKFRGMKIMSKGLKKSVTSNPTSAPTSTTNESFSQANLPVIDEKSDKDLFLHAIQQLHATYEKAASEQHFALTTSTSEDKAPPDEPVPSMITPTLVNETPTLNLPQNMVVLLQEETRSASGIGMGLKDLWEGQVASTPHDADVLERVAPSWLAFLLLRNVLPRPEIPKISFMLEPWQGELPRVCAEQNTRLNANRMLRARKIMGYVAERIETAEDRERGVAMKPEEYLELYCNNQLITPLMTLGTIRSYVWRAGTDILFYYKSNGKKEIRSQTQTASMLI